jgi:hypothetical protein
LLRFRHKVVIGHKSDSCKERSCRDNGTFRISERLIVKKKRVGNSDPDSIKMGGRYPHTPYDDSAAAPVGRPGGGSNSEMYCCDRVKHSSAYLPKMTKRHEKQVLREVIIFGNSSFDATKHSFRWFHLRDNTCLIKEILIKPADFGFR